MRNPRRLFCQEPGELRTEVCPFALARHPLEVVNSILLLLQLLVDLALRPSPQVILPLQLPVMSWFGQGQVISPPPETLR